MITPNTPIEIRKVGNGFIVKEMTYDAAVRGADDDTLVFETLGSLQNFVEVHFAAVFSKESNARIMQDIAKPLAQ